MKKLIIILSAAAILFAGSASLVIGLGARETSEIDYRDPNTLLELISGEESSYLLIDVRTPGEFSTGHIATSINIPVDVIGREMPDVPLDFLVILYCRTGSRSAQAGRILSDLGYTNIIDFGGINRWPHALRAGN